MAGYNDSFSVKTPNGCGSIEFVDYGDTPWGKQDDFVIVHDLCGDGRGVRGYATSWVPGQESSVSTITCHNSNGLAGAAKYCTLPELSAGDRLLLQVELTKDGTPSPAPWARPSTTCTTTELRHCACSAWRPMVLRAEAPHQMPPHVLVRAP
jgi:hypothetical protein